MRTDMSSGLGQADLTLNYENHRKKGSGFRLKDVQIFIAEYIGTFLLTFVVASSKTSNSPDLIPFAVGSVLIALIHSFGPISGGQFNPAATIALLLRYKLNLIEGVYCIISQVLGALSAGIVSWFLFNDDWESVGYPEVTDPTKRSQAFLGEFLITYAIMAVALNTATTKAQADNSYFGMAIGFVVISGALVLGDVSGACFNPAISLLTVLHGRYGDLWVFTLAPLLGATAAGILFRVNNPSEWDDSDPIITRFSLDHHNSDGSILRRISMLFQEFQGTFFITWVVALSINVTDSVGTLGIALMMISFVYSGGAVSGAHYNPCVTLAVYIRSFKDGINDMRLLDAILYMIVQFIAAYVGGGTAAYVNSGFANIYSPIVNYEDHSIFQAFIVEFMFSTALVLTVLFTGTSENVSGNSFFGIAIGFMTLGSVVVAQNISGSIFNPAVSIALSSLTNRQSEDAWIYLIGDMSGGIVGAFLYKFLNLPSTTDASNSSNNNHNRNKSSHKKGPSLERCIKQSLLPQQDEDLDSSV